MAHSLHLIFSPLHFAETLSSWSCESEFELRIHQYAKGNLHDGIMSNSLPFILCIVQRNSWQSVVGPEHWRNLDCCLHLRIAFSSTILGTFSSFPFLGTWVPNHDIKDCPMVPHITLWIDTGWITTLGFDWNPHPTRRELSACASPLALLCTSRRIHHVCTAKNQSLRHDPELPRLH